MTEDLPGQARIAAGAGAASVVIFGSGRGQSPVAMTPAFSIISTASGPAPWAGPWTGGAILAATDGGTRWAIQSEPQYQLNAVSCPTSSVCVAIGLADSSYATSDGGSDWTAGGGMPEAEWVAGVACPSASDCWAAGFKGTGIGLVVATTNRASAWTAEPGPDGPSMLTGLSCPTISGCESLPPSFTGPAAVRARRLLTAGQSGRQTDLVLLR